MRFKRLLLSLVVGAAGGVLGAVLAVGVSAFITNDGGDTSIIFAPKTSERQIGSSSVRVTYPVIADSAVNEAIERDMARRVASFTQTVASATPSRPYELTGGFNRPYLTRERLSYVQTVYEYTGGAHGITHVSGENRRRSDGSTIELTDVFDRDRAYLQFLASSSRAQLKERLPSLFESGLQPTVDNFDNFYLGPDHFVVIFPQYQVASYAAGTQEVSFSYDELKPYLRPMFRPSR
jgi:hypothetical protein